jgi:hypothetical protein
VAMSIFRPFNFGEVWDHLQTIEKPDFKMKFDNIATMKKEDGKWVVDRVWEIGT